MTLRLPGDITPLHAQTDGCVWISIGYWITQDPTHGRALVDELPDVLGPDFSETKGEETRYNCLATHMLLDHDPELQKLEAWLRRAARREVGGSRN